MICVSRVGITEITTLMTKHLVLLVLERVQIPTMQVGQLVIGLAFALAS